MDAKSVQLMASKSRSGVHVSGVSRRVAMLVVGSGLKTASGRRGVLVLQGHLFSVEEGGGGGTGCRTGEAGW